MTEPRRLTDLSTALPHELSLALKGAPRGPTGFEQRALLQNLSSTLGIALALPAVAANLSAAPSGPAVASASATAGLAAQAPTAIGLAAKPGASFLLWFGGGLTLGTALSAAAVLSAQLLGSPSSVDHQPTPSASSATHRASAPATPLSAPAELREPEVDAGVRAVQPAPESAARSATREKSREQPVPEVGSEFSLLRSAQQALPADPLRALDFCSRYTTQFPDGVMAQEREMIAIEALLRLGRSQEANARAATFFRLFPGSAHTVRLRRLLQRTKF